MLLRFVLVATLAVGVLGRNTFSKFYNNYDPYYEGTQLRATEYCKAIHAEDKVPEVTSSIKTFAKCMNDLLDGETMRRDMWEAITTGTSDTLIRKYCPKASQLRDCARDFVKGVTLCLPREEAAWLISTNTMTYFFCENDGARITSLFQEGGHQCIQKKQHGIVLCQKEAHYRYYNIFNVTNAMNTYGKAVDKEMCSFTNHVLTCMANVYKGCSTPTPGKLMQEFRDVFLESMSCPKESEVQTLPASAVNKEMEKLKKKKLELEIRIAELEMWNRENQLHVLHTDLTSDIKSSL